MTDVDMDNPSVKFLWDQFILLTHRVRILEERIQCIPYDNSMQPNIKPFQPYESNKSNNHNFTNINLREQNYY